MQRCLHCLEPACVAACPTTALQRQADGPVSYDDDECIGCRYCQLACPWDVPTAEWNSLRAEDLQVHALRRPRRAAGADRVQRAGRLRRREQAVHRQHRDSGLRQGVPRRRAASTAHATRCWREAHKRIAARPDKYVDHIYGEKELGGTSVLYLSRVPFEKLGFPTSARSRSRLSPRRRSAPFRPP